MFHAARDPNFQTEEISSSMLFGTAWEEHDWFYSSGSSPGVHVPLGGTKH